MFTITMIGHALQYMKYPGTCPEYDQEIQVAYPGTPEQVDRYIDFISLIVVPSFLGVYIHQFSTAGGPFVVVQLHKT